VSMQRRVGWRQFGTGPGCGSAGPQSGGSSPVQSRFGTGAPAAAGEVHNPAASAARPQATPILNLLATGRGC
jgi:hypothetical protein